MMDIEVYLFYVCFIFLQNIIKSIGLKCFECDNLDNPACGEYFKPYQFRPSECWGYVKCGLQRQQPLKDAGNFIGIIRRCYYLGTLPGIDETDGCRAYVMPPHNNTLQYCFCSKDYCNNASLLTPQWLTTVSLLFLLIILFHILHR